MSGVKHIVFAFALLRESAHAVQLAQMIESFGSSRQDLMNIGLVPYVPYDFVFRGIENLMESNGDFHHAKIGGQMSPGPGYFLNEKIADLIGEKLQLFHIHGFQITRKMMIIYVIAHVNFL